MANAPTRPPNTSRYGRRPPRGPRHVASDLRSRLKKASAQLKTDGHPELSAAVDAVLAPGGWSKLRAEPGTASASNLPLYMPASLREALKTAADQMDVSLGALVTEGFRAAVAGAWTPPPAPARSSRGSAAGQGKVNLNVRVDDASRSAVEEALPRLAAEAGGRLSLTSIAIAWLTDELGVDPEALPDAPVSEESTEGASAPKRVRKRSTKPVPVEYEGRELWTAMQCAKFRGMTRKKWLEAVEFGVVPKPVWTAAGQIPMWDADAVRAIEQQ